LVNARVVTPEGVQPTIRFASRVLDLGASPRDGDHVVDLGGAWVVPGLINAHDHLELNHYGRLKRRDRYDNASAWVDDLVTVIDRDPTIARLRAHPLRDRLFVGALKNVLAGVTAVAHHNPLYGEIDRAWPIRVVTRFGWAHSLSMAHRPVGANGEPGGDVRARYLDTPSDHPFIVHAGEGTDRGAVDELAELETAGCLGANTVLVHGVAFDPERWRRVAAHGTSLVWCPASNLFLLGKTIDARALLDAAGCGPGRICLGTDSRLTGSSDLLEELRVAQRCASLTPGELLAMVTTSAADALGIPEAGRLAVGHPADLVVVPATHSDPASSLLHARRSDLGLVVVGGDPVVGAPAWAEIFHARGVTVDTLDLDGCARSADRRLVARMARLQINPAAWN
jgi:cytosine/adenosine deaminase-related metal-dependent hydrolase